MASTTATSQEKTDLAREVARVEAHVQKKHKISQLTISPASNSSSSGPGQKEPLRKASPRKSLQHRKRIEIE
ncbi:hypothetical protein JZ751_004428, partial [Albula glossodonta]